jgi:Tfp pilus assembly protein FimT
LDPTPKKGFKYGIEDLLVVMAILMILTAMVVPHFAKPTATKAKSPAAHPTSNVKRAR